MLGACCAFGKTRQMPQNGGTHDKVVRMVGIVMLGRLGMTIHDSWNQGLRMTLMRGIERNTSTRPPID